MSWLEKRRDQLLASMNCDTCKYREDCIRCNEGTSDYCELEEEIYVGFVNACESVNN